MKPRLSAQARRILEIFVERYPTSAQFRGGRRLRLSNWPQRLPGIAGDLDRKEDFLDAVDELVRSGVLSVRWQRFRSDEEVEALYLENPDVLYQLLGEKTPKKKRDELRQALLAFPWTERSLRGAVGRLDRLLGEDGDVAVQDPAELFDIGHFVMMVRADYTCIRFYNHLFTADCRGDCVFKRRK